MGKHIPESKVPQTIARCPTSHSEPTVSAFPTFAAVTDEDEIVICFNLFVDSSILDCFHLCLAGNYSFYLAAY